MAWFSCRGACKIDSFVGIEIDSTSVMGSKFSFVWGVEMDLVLVWGMKLTCFCAGVKIDFVAEIVSKITCF